MACDMECRLLELTEVLWSWEYSSMPLGARTRRGRSKFDRVLFILCRGCMLYLLCISIKSCGRGNGRLVCASLLPKGHFVGG